MEGEELTVSGFAFSSWKCQCKVPLGLHSKILLFRIHTRRQVTLVPSRWALAWERPGTSSYLKGSRIQHCLQAGDMYLMSMGVLLRDFEHMSCVTNETQVQ